jgi:hypothetical protein
LDSLRHCRLAVVDPEIDDGHRAIMDVIPVDDQPRSSRLPDIANPFPAASAVVGRDAEIASAVPAAVVAAIAASPVVL